jgi:hypothetical protein
MMMLANLSFFAIVFTFIFKFKCSHCIYG